MSSLNLIKIPIVPASFFLSRIEPSAEAHALLQTDMAVADYVEILLQAGLYRDLISFLAQALPPREATWWACLCVRDATLSESSAASEMEALAAAERWVYQPSEENRRLAMDAAEATRFNHPASWAGVSAFWSGGSLAPENSPTVPPGEDLKGRAVAGAVLLAAVHNEPERMEEKYRLFLSRALDIAAGGNGREPALLL